ncbi:HEAT repeat-containing protein 5, partial [Tremellales sp. Uapishka_1]
MTDMSAEDLKVDESRFTGDGSDLSLLQWLRHAEQAIEVLPTETLQGTIPSLHTFFLHILSPSPNQTLPRPGRPIRHLVTRCVVKLHKKVESRSLFDFVQALVKGVSDGGGKGMSAGENVARVASWYCIGEVIKELGTNMMSFMAEICSSSTKVLKNSNLTVILRSHAVLAFSKSLVSAGRAIPDALVKDLLKTLRSGLSDRALPIQRACAEAFVSLQTHTSILPLQQTVETVSPLVLKSLETADYLTRRALSRLLAHLLAASQVPGSGVVVERKVAKKDEGEQDSGPSVVTSAAEDRGAKTLYTTGEMLKHLSTPYSRPQASRKLRNALIDVYATLFTALGATYVENHYPEIVKHVVDDVIVPHRGQSSRYESLATREMVGLVLRDLIGVRLLSEAGQIMAVREWTNNYIKKWQSPPLPGQPKIDKQVLVVGLREVAGLLDQLGNAPPAIIELLAEPLVRLLSHPSYTVRLGASYTLRRFCTINPSQLPRMLNILVGDLSKDLGLLGTPTASDELPDRLIGKSLALSALITISSSRPLYVSHDISTKVFDLSVALLKRSGDHDIKVANIEVQVAWYLVSSLMSLGPSFVKLHLPQLLVLWRNALPKPTSKDSSVGERGEVEWNFLLLVRECTLSATLNFLRHNQSLVNIDVARRLATLYTNTLNFVNGFATAYAEALKEQQVNPAAASPIFTTRPSLVEREANLRRRVLQCFTTLGPSSATESMQSALLQAAVTVFADPENYSGSQAQAAIAAQAGQFTSVWQATDGYAFGVTSLLGEREFAEEEGFLNRDKIEMWIESQLSHPILGSIEHDFLTLLTATPLFTSPRPVPAQTGVIDAGVELFSTMFSYQNVEGQVQSLATLSSHVRSSKLEKNPGRRQAVVANTMAALRKSLENAESGGGGRMRKTLGSGQVSDMIRSLLQDAILDPAPSIRTAAAEAMGILTSLAGSNFLTSQIQWLVDQVVNNRVPDSRAGCALAFGSIYSHVGGLAGGPILKTIVNILMSLATDPHPVVHFYAMSALSQTINAANLAYSPFVPTTLGMLANIYLLETHEPDGGSLGSVNLRGDLPAYQAICRILQALIGVLGPELQEPSKIRSLVFLLVHEFGEETDEGLAVEAIKCQQQFLMFAPSEMDLPSLVSTFRSHLNSTRRPLKVAAITALYQIVQRDAVLMSKLGGNSLVEDLFGLLDDDPSIEGVRQVIKSWLNQTAGILPNGWIDLCQRIMIRSTKPKPLPRTQVTQGPSFLDDEGESLGAETTTSTTGSNSRWRTQLFALECLHDIIQSVKDSSKNEHFDPRLGGNKKQMLFSRVADLIRMAFSASAALVMEVRLAGLVVLRDVIEVSRPSHSFEYMDLMKAQNFSSSEDPDFEGALLLEQHQAPIAAALTPSFGNDSTPEVLASAVQVCAVFVGSGVIKEVHRMGRILKLLTGALEQCKDGAMLSLGDVEELSSNASVMLKVSIMAAWAELQIASTRQAYLKDVIEPFRYLLGPFWIGALRDYSMLRTDPEMGVGASLDSGLGREVLLPYYERSVSKLLYAVGISLSTSDPFVIGSMDGQTFTSAVEPPQTTSLAKVEPVTNFYIVYGLAFENLVKSMTSDAEQASISLNIMESLVRPSLSGTTVFEGAFFDELITVCYRISMSEPAKVKCGMVEVLIAFVVSRVGLGSYDQAQARRVLAVLTFVLRGCIPSRETGSTFLYSDTAADRISFLKVAFGGFSKIVDTIDISQRADLCAVGIHLFSDILKDETPNMDLGGATLPSLKLLLDQLVSVQVPGIEATADRVVHGLLSGCVTNIDDMRARQGQVADCKIKNNLLAITLILTSLPSSVRVSQILIESISYVMGQYLGQGSERLELGLTPIRCTTTLLLASLRPIPSIVPNSKPTPSVILQHAALHLLPPLIGYIAEAVLQDDSPTLVDGVKEVTRGLVAWVNGLPEETRPRGYTILLPTLLLLLQSPGLNHVGTASLLALAQASPKSFKDATLVMDATERAKLETGIREAVGNQGGMAGDKKSTSSGGIELKSFG